MKRKPIDWEAIEREYRMGTKSMRMLASEYNINVSNISRRVKKYNWVQDKSDEIRQRTHAALVAQQGRNTPTGEDIETQVQSNLSVITGHRGDIRQGRQLVGLLSQQLDAAASSRDELEKEIIEDTEGPDGGKPDLRRRNFMLKAVSLPSHAGTLRDLSTALKNLIPLERQAFNLDEPGANINDILAALPGEFREAVRRRLTEAVS